MPEPPQTINLVDLLPYAIEAGVIDEWDIHGPFIKLLHTGTCTFYVHIRWADGLLTSMLREKAAGAGVLATERISML